MNVTKVSSLLLGLGCCFIASLPCRAQSASRFFQPREDPESFHIELTGSGWLVNPGGVIQANGAPVDLVNDLRVNQGQNTFFGQLVFKPKRRHRIIVEGAPFRLSGTNIIDRSFTYRGRVFNVSETTQSTAKLDYFFAGYQYDLVSNSSGHFGLSVGGAYLSATGTIIGSGTVQSTASKTETIGLPLSGADFRIFPIPHHKFFEVEGGIRGMAFGDYGYYVQASASGGFVVGPISLLGGYRAVNTSLFVSNSAGFPSGLTARLQGPIFSGVFRW